MASLFLSAEEADLTGLFLGRQADLFQTEPEFGAAGGPDRTGLSEMGRERAYNIASVYRLRLGIAHIEVLTTIASYGEVGMPLRGMKPGLYDAAHALADLSIKDRSQEALAASLGGDDAAWGRIRDENRLLWLDQTAGGPGLDVWRVTPTGQALITAAAAVERSMLLHQLKTGSCHGQRSMSSNTSLDIPSGFRNLPNR